MAEPCMICGDEVSKAPHEACLKNTNMEYCPHHDIIHWKFAQCPMCKFSLNKTECRNGEYFVVGTIPDWGAGKR